MVDGPGVRTTIFCSGCPLHCEGCHNKSIWSPDKGIPLTDEMLKGILNSIAPEYITGATMCGGEPLAEYNIAGTQAILEAIRKTYGNSKSIMLYTGYLFEEIPERIKNLVDIVIDGKYDMTKPTTKRFRGSDNQKMWVKKDGLWKEGI